MVTENSPRRILNWNSANFLVVFGDIHSPVLGGGTNVEGAGHRSKSSRHHRTDCRRKPPYASIVSGDPWRFLTESDMGRTSIGETFPPPPPRLRDRYRGDSPCPPPPPQWEH